MELQEADLVSDDQLSTPITPPVAGHLCVSVVVQIDPCAKVLFIYWWRRDKLKREGRYYGVYIYLLLRAEGSSVSSFGRIN